MNILNRIFNAISPGSTAASTATASAPGTPAPTVESYRAANPNSQLDSFETKFGLYFPDSTWRGREFMTTNRPAVPRKLIQMILDRAGEIFSEADISKLRELRARQDAIHAKLEEFNFWASTRIFQAQQDTAVQKLLAGDLPDANLKSKLEIRSSIQQAREALHADLLPLGQNVFDLLAPMCGKLRAVARDLCEKQDAKERAVHESNVGNEQPFIPSTYLKTLAFIALSSCDAPVRNFYLTKRLHCPDPDRLLDLWFPPVGNPPTRPASPAGEHPQVKAQREALAAIIKTDHEKQLAEKNALVEKVKRDLQTTAEQTELARVKTAMETETRTAALKNKILADAAAAKPDATKPSA